MRIQLTIMAVLISSLALATDDKSMQELFKKYDSVMDHKKVELIDEVFTQKFIKNSGGKKELVEKIKELSVPSEKAATKSEMTWKKGQKGEVFLAKVKEIPINKMAKPDKKIKEEKHEAEFVVLKENGKLKIDGTLSDGD